MTPLSAIGRQAENFFAQYDTNRDGTVDAHEFVGAALRHLEDMHVTDPATVESVAAYHERLLAVCDIDGDGLSQREFECMEYVAAYSLPSRVQTRIAALVGEARSDTDEFGLRSAVSEVNLRSPRMFLRAVARFTWNPPDNFDYWWPAELATNS